MMNKIECPLQLPFLRPHPSRMSPQYQELQISGRIAPVLTPAGHPAWLVTRRDQLWQLMADDRLGRVHADPANAPMFSATNQLYGPQGTDHTSLETELAKLRQVTNRSFSARRMHGIRPRLLELVNGLLDELEAAGSPADLHATLAAPLPILVICELLGVPHDDRAEFQAWNADLIHLVDVERVGAALGKLNEYLRKIMVRKREEPTDDALTDLVQACDSGEITEDMAVKWAVALLFAGHVTTVVRISTGVLFLLEHPEQRQEMLTDANSVPKAVEEILRISQPDLGLAWRWANVDIEVDEVTIKAGDLVLFAFGAACLDPTAYSEPERFNISRAEEPHTAFGHGPHFCSGASLARVELEVVFSTLFRRFPDLRLAVTRDELRWHNEQLTGGPMALPVSW